MAASKKDSTENQKPKKSVSLREQAKKTQDSKPKQRRLHTTAKRVTRPIKAAKRIGSKEYYLPLPDNKVGTFLNKKRRVTPSFFVEAWRELKQVSWPNRRETVKLTTAVTIFSITFGALIAIVDYGLDKLFKELLLK